MYQLRSQMWGLCIASLYLCLAVNGFSLYRAAYIAVVWQPRCWTHITAIQPNARSTLEFVTLVSDKGRKIAWCTFRDTRTQCVVEVRADDRDVGLVLGWGVWFILCMIIGVRLTPKRQSTPTYRSKP